MLIIISEIISYNNVYGELLFVIIIIRPELIIIIRSNFCELISLYVDAGASTLCD